MPIDGQIIAAIKRAAPSIEHRVSRADMEVIVATTLAYSDCPSTPTKAQERT